MVLGAEAEALDSLGNFTYTLILMLTSARVLSLEIWHAVVLGCTTLD